MATQQSDTSVNYANQVQNLIQQMCNIRDQAAALVAKNTTVPLGNGWNKLNTTAIQNDGTLGTADTLGTPNLSNPVDPRQYPALNRVSKASDFANGLAVLVDFGTFCSGGSLAINGARTGQMDTLGM